MTKSVSSKPRSPPDIPVAAVTLNDQPMRVPIELPDSTAGSSLYQTLPARCYYVDCQGEQTYRSSPIYGGTGFHDQTETLMLHGLDNWEQPGP